MCSTPFGIKDQITPRFSASAIAARCSTPFGIKDQITPAASAPPPSVRCAQRLSASKIKSPIIKNPFQLCFFVLNAFRHQRSNHSGLLWAGYHNMACAQRLSASKIKSLKVAVRCPGNRTVLNAFRHQRSNHYECETEFHPLNTVLNAFRHQRSNHGKGMSLSRVVSGAQRLSASKIKSRPTFTRRLPGLGVLNAFRHQRSNHCSGAADVSNFSVCSTPFGIKDQITSPPTWKFNDGDTCSTPFGIKDQITPPRKNRVGVPAHVLNAFRHQRSNHAGGAFFGRRRTVCSTPFGIKDQITNNKPIIKGADDACSTPFGIKDQITQG